MTEQSKIVDLKGVGDKTEKLFRKLNIYTVGDLLRYYPRSYDIYEVPMPIQSAEEGKMVAVTGNVYGKVQVTAMRNLQVTTAYVKDLTGTLKVVWFNMPFLKNTLRSGSVVTLRGRIVNKRGGLQMEQPEIYFPSSSYDAKRDTMQPIYPLTAGLSNQAIIKAMKQAIQYPDLKKEFLPSSIRMQYNLAEYNYAVRQIHFPEDKQDFYLARERLVFEEFLIFILALRQIKESNERQKNIFKFSNQNRIEQFIKELPYDLTNAQKKVWDEIKQDMCGDNVMARLIQGDVGSGKTIISAFHCIAASI